MSHRSFLISITFVVLLCCLPARSQAPGPKARSDYAASSELKKKALDSLHTIASRLNTLRSPENRARIGSNLGDLLWEDDEKSSRTLFAAVGEDINEGFANNEPDPQTGNHAILVFRQLRSDTLARIARHDPDLALTFLRATRPPAAARLPYDGEDTERVLELRLASQIAAKRPELALKLGRESLARGFSTDLLTVLDQLRTRDKASASSFFKEIVDKLKDVKLADDWQASEVAFSLVGSFQPSEIEEPVYRDLIGILLSNALANGCAKARAEDEGGPQICYQVGSIFSELDKYYGSKAAPLKRWAQADEEISVPSPDGWTQIYQVVERGSADEIRELATKNPGVQYQIYAMAIRKMEESADFVRARQLASDFPDLEVRGTLLAEITLDEKRSADNQALGQRGLANFRNSQQRLDYLFQTASRIVESDPKAALRLLDEAGPLIDSLKPGSAKVRAQIVQAMLYCWLKSDRGFAIMESLMPKLNELVTAAAALDAFETNYLSDEGEWNMSGEGTVGGLLTVLANNSAFFARLDFDRSIALANQIERPELQMMAQLKIAQSVLSNQPLQLPPFSNRVP